jgi:8-oxo-dGTP pyrophosphatase MutT (NUDIX family)
LDREVQKHEVSAGIVVFANDRVLVIRNRFGEWVLPKGKVEPEETPPEAALREVFEETGVRAELMCSLGTTDYTYVSDATGELIDKTVYWYAGAPIENDNGVYPHTEPQREEGISYAGFVPWRSARDMLTYKDSRNLVSLVVSLAHERLSKTEPF